MKKFHSVTRYDSPIISVLKKKAIELDKLKKKLLPLEIDLGSATVLLPRSFGFCYGVENAIEITHQAIKENPDKRIFILSELIHNQYINDYFINKGVKFLMNRQYEPIYDLDDLTKEDIIIIPAFGAPIWVQDQLSKRNLSIEKYHTTCPFVVKVWKTGESLASKGFTLVIHGTVGHEETESTRSRFLNDKTPYVIVKDIAQTELLVSYLKQQRTQAEFEEDFQGCHSQDFDITKDLRKVAVINQTTMIALETQAIMNMLKEAIKNHYALDEDTIDDYFAKTRDTLCYATNDNQKALAHILENYTIDMSIAIGGINSSNTSHLAELCAKKTKNYFVSLADDLIDHQTIKHFNSHKKEQLIVYNYLDEVIQKIDKGEKPIILLVAGASSPDIIIECILERLATLIPNASLPVMEAS